MNERGLRQVDILEMARPYCEKYSAKLRKNDLSQYVSGKVEPGQDKLTVLGLALDLSEAWLMGYDVPKERISGMPPDVETQAKLYDAADAAVQNKDFFELSNDEKRHSLQDANKNAPSISDGAMKLARDYDTLDNWGKQAVRELADTELARMGDESRFLSQAQVEPEPKIIPLYLSAPAAGIATPILGEDYDEYTLSPEDPQGAMFAVKVGGNSMEPLFPDGSTVFCNRDPLADGDIGVFSIDGGSVIKQYHYDSMLGMTYLFSLNRDRADADVLLTPSSGQTLVCLGRVMTKHRYPLPRM